MHYRHHRVSRKSGFNLVINIELVQNVESELSEEGRDIEFAYVKLSEVLNLGLSQIKKFLKL